MPVETGTSARSASCHRRGERSEAVGDVCEDQPRLGVLVLAQPGASAVLLRELQEEVFLRFGGDSRSPKAELAAKLPATAPEEPTNVEQLEAALPLTT